MSASGPRKDFDFIPIPQRLRYDPKRPFPEFGIGRILLFRVCVHIWYVFHAPFIVSILFISMITVVANLYYCQTLLCASGSLDISKMMELIVHSSPVL